MLERLRGSRLPLLAGTAFLGGAVRAASIGSAFAASASDDTWATKSSMTTTTWRAGDDSRVRIGAVGGEQ